MIRGDYSFLQYWLDSDSGKHFVSQVAERVAEYFRPSWFNTRFFESGTDSQADAVFSQTTRYSISELTEDYTDGTENHDQSSSESETDDETTEWILNSTEPLGEVTTKTQQLSSLPLLKKEEFTSEPTSADRKTENECDLLIQQNRNISEIDKILNTDQPADRTAELNSESKELSASVSHEVQASSVSTGASDTRLSASIPSLSYNKLTATGQSQGHYSKSYFGSSKSDNDQPVSINAAGDPLQTVEMILPKSIHRVRSLDNEDIPFQHLFRKAVKRKRNENLKAKRSPYKDTLAIKTNQAPEDIDDKTFPSVEMPQFKKTKRALTDTRPPTPMVTKAFTLSNTEDKIIQLPNDSKKNCEITRMQHMDSSSASIKRRGDDSLTEECCSTKYLKRESSSSTVSATNNQDTNAETAANKSQELLQLITDKSNSSGIQWENEAAPPVAVTTETQELSLLSLPKEEDVASELSSANNEIGKKENGHVGSSKSDTDQQSSLTANHSKSFETASQEAVLRSTLSENNEKLSEPLFRKAAKHEIHDDPENTKPYYQGTLATRIKQALQDIDNELFPPEKTTPTKKEQMALTNTHSSGPKDKVAFPFIKSEDVFQLDRGFSPLHKLMCINFPKTIDELELKMIRGEYNSLRYWLNSDDGSQRVAKRVAEFLRPSWLSTLVSKSSKDSLGASTTPQTMGRPKSAITRNCTDGPGSHDQTVWEREPKAETGGEINSTESQVSTVLKTQQVSSPALYKETEQIGVKEHGFLQQNSRNIPEMDKRSHKSQSKDRSAEFKSESEKIPPTVFSEVQSSSASSGTQPSASLPSISCNSLGSATRYDDSYYKGHAGSLKSDNDQPGSANMSQHKTSEDICHKTIYNGTPSDYDEEIPIKPLVKTTIKRKRKAEPKNTRLLYQGTLAMRIKKALQDIDEALFSSDEMPPSKKVRATLTDTPSSKSKAKDKQQIQSRDEPQLSSNLAGIQPMDTSPVSFKRRGEKSSYEESCAQKYFKEGPSRSSVRVINKSLETKAKGATKEKKDEWKCRTCFKSNNLKEQACSTCRRRNPAFINYQVVDLEIERQREVARKKFWKELPKWKCVMCRFPNRLDRSVCYACGWYKPGMESSLGDLEKGRRLPMCDNQLGVVMSLVIREVNFIVTQALSYHQFKVLLNEVDGNYPGLVSLSEISLIEIAYLKASDMWVNKLKSLNEEERLAQRQAELASSLNTN
ncbi:serine-rich adhesin for platelets-like [Watersipora subatra]|uniref:serine-rich adhesin for platelets-like n=1 Tax=Watersipora subatra TaxID=2589382 RepID=UPI00355C7146